MGWRDFPEPPQVEFMEFMEFMESINTITPLIPFIPLIPVEESPERPQCRFWEQVCHAVGMYQDECTRSGDEQCKVFRFLKINNKTITANGEAMNQKGK